MTLYQVFYHNRRLGDEKPLYTSHKTATDVVKELVGLDLQERFDVGRVEEGGSPTALPSYVSADILTGLYGDHRMTPERFRVVARPFLRNGLPGLAPMLRKHLQDMFGMVPDTGSGTETSDPAPISAPAPTPVRASTPVLVKAVPVPEAEEVPASVPKNGTGCKDVLPAAPKRLTMPKSVTTPADLKALRQCLGAPAALMAEMLGLKRTRTYLDYENGSRPLSGDVCSKATRLATAEDITRGRCVINFVDRLHRVEAFMNANTSRLVTLTGIPFLRVSEILTDPLVELVPFEEHAIYALDNKFSVVIAKPDDGHLTPKEPVFKDDWDRRSTMSRDMALRRATFNFIWNVVQDMPKSGRKFGPDETVATFTGNDKGTVQGVRKGERDLRTLAKTPDELREVVHMLVTGTIPDGHDAISSDLIPKTNDHLQAKFNAKSLLAEVTPLFVAHADKVKSSAVKPDGELQTAASA